MKNNLMNEIFAKAKANPKRVAFPEANNIKMLAAMQEVASQGYAETVVVGNIEEVKTLVKENNIDDSKFKYIDNLDEKYSNDVLQRYLKLPNIIFGEKSVPTISKTSGNSSINISPPPVPKSNILDFFVAFSFNILDKSQFVKLSISQFIWLKSQFFILL